jgi:hypothetical protein
MRETADRLAQQQPTPEKAEQVRRNTLAVYAVDHYCQLLGIPTDLTATDWWQPLKRLGADVADLQLVDIGRLECRPLDHDGQVCQIPPEVWGDRIGYVAVQLDETAAEATLKGFFPNAIAEQMPLRQLRSLDELIDRIDRLRQASSPSIRPATNLGQWLIGQATSGWQSIESLLNLLNAEPAFAFRSGGADSSDADEANPDRGNGQGSRQGSRQAKLIHLSTPEVDYPLALVVELIPRSDGRYSISIRVHTIEAQTVLPQGLSLRVWGANSESAALLETEARQADDYIQLRLRGITGEQFRVEMALDGASLFEDFVI